MARPVMELPDGRIKYDDGSISKPLAPVQTTSLNIGRGNVGTTNVVPIAPQEIPMSFPTTTQDNTSNIGVLRGLSNVAKFGLTNEEAHPAVKYFDAGLTAGKEGGQDVGHVVGEILTGGFKNMAQGGGTLYRGVMEEPREKETKLGNVISGLAQIGFGGIQEYYALNPFTALNNLAVSLGFHYSGVGEKIGKVTEGISNEYVRPNAARIGLPLTTEGGSSLVNMLLPWASIKTLEGTINVGRSTYRAAKGITQGSIDKVIGEKFEQERINNNGGTAELFDKAIVDKLSTLDTIVRDKAREVTGYDVKKALGDTLGKDSPSPFLDQMGEQLYGESTPQYRAVANWIEDNGYDVTKATNKERIIEGVAKEYDINQDLVSGYVDKIANNIRETTKNFKSDFEVLDAVKNGLKQMGNEAYSSLQRLYENNLLDFRQVDDSLVFSTTEKAKALGKESKDYISSDLDGFFNKSNDPTPFGATQEILAEEMNKKVGNAVENDITSIGRVVTKLQEAKGDLGKIITLSKEAKPLAFLNETKSKLAEYIEEPTTRLATELKARISKIEKDFGVKATGVVDEVMNIGTTRGMETRINADAGIDFMGKAYKNYQKDIYSGVAHEPKVQARISQVRKLAEAGFKLGGEKAKAKLQIKIDGLKRQLNVAKGNAKAKLQSQINETRMQMNQRTSHAKIASDFMKSETNRITNMSSKISFKGGHQKLFNEGQRLISTGGAKLIKAKTLGEFNAGMDLVSQGIKQSEVAIHGQKISNILSKYIKEETVSTTKKKHIDPNVRMFLEQTAKVFDTMDFKNAKVQDLIDLHDMIAGIEKYGRQMTNIKRILSKDEFNKVMEEGLPMIEEGQNLTDRNFQEKTTGALSGAYVNLSRRLDKLFSWKYNNPLYKKLVEEPTQAYNEYQAKKVAMVDKLTEALEGLQGLGKNTNHAMEMLGAYFLKRRADWKDIERGILKGGRDDVIYRIDTLERQLLDEVSKSKKYTKLMDNLEKVHDEIIEQVSAYSHEELLKNGYLVGKIKDYSPLRNIKADEKPITSMNDIQSNYGGNYARTPGSTKKTTYSATDPQLNFMRTMTSFISDNIRYATIKNAVNTLNRFLGDGRLLSKLGGTNSEGYRDLSTLRDVLLETTRKTDAEGLVKFAGMMNRISAERTYSMNFGTVAQQPLSLIDALPVIGPRFMIKGFEVARKVNDNGMLNIDLIRSSNADLRKAFGGDITQAEIMSATSRNMIGKGAQFIRKNLMSTIGFVDGEIRTSLYTGAYIKYLVENKVINKATGKPYTIDDSISSFTNKDAQFYATKTINKLMGAVGEIDIPPVLSSPLGKAIFPFSTTMMNRIGMYLYDIPEAYRNQGLANAVARFTAYSVADVTSTIVSALNLRYRSQASGEEKDKKKIEDFLFNPTGDKNFKFNEDKLAQYFGIAYVKSFLGNFTSTLGPVSDVANNAITGVARELLINDKPNWNNLIRDIKSAGVEIPAVETSKDIFIYGTSLLTDAIKSSGTSFEEQAYNLGRILNLYVGGKDFKKWLDVQGKKEGFDKTSKSKGGFGFGSSDFGFKSKDEFGFK